MAKQKLIASAELVMEGTDIFEATDNARAARTVLEQAQAEIQKTFPDFKFSFTVAQYREPGSPTPGRRRGGTNAATGENTVAGAAAGGEATIAGAAAGEVAPIAPPPPPPAADAKAPKGQPAAAAA